MIFPLEQQPIYIILTGHIEMCREASRDHKLAPLAEEMDESMC
jgi:hypothetical protein